MIVDDFLMLEIIGCLNIKLEVLCCRNYFILRIYVIFIYFFLYLDIFVIYKKLNLN